MSEAPGFEASAIIELADVVDELTTGDGTVVMVGRLGGSRVVRLSSLGGEILGAVRRGAKSLEALERELRSRLGEPEVGEVSSLVREAVLSMTEVGILIGTEASGPPTGTVS